MRKDAQFIISSVFWLAVALFWFLAYPQALGFQEQNQLFLYTWDYLGERLSVTGGLADWIAEFLTQFNFIPLLGALLLAGLFVLLQMLVWKLSGSDSLEWYPLSYIPSLLVLVQMGDIYVMPSHLVALVLAAALSLVYIKKPSVWLPLLAIPLGFWLIGPAICVFVLFVLLGSRKPSALLYPVYLLLVVFLFRVTLMQQYPPKSVFFGVNYYRWPLTVPVLQLVAAASVFLVPVVIRLLPKVRNPLMAAISCGCVLAAGAFLGIRSTYDRDTYEIIAYDQLVRHERWQKVVERAGRYQPKSDIGCVSVNLALFMTGKMDSMDDYYQCGTRGLIMPRVRDLISNVSSYEVFWRMGFVNSALRYAFDSQEAEMNYRKSGRFMSKMAECQIVNGRYEVARKYLDILKHSLFYSKWAKSREVLLGNEELISAVPVYSYLRAVKFSERFLFNYGEMDKMLYILASHNQNNIMAKAYFLAWKRLQEAGGGAQ